MGDALFETSRLIIRPKSPEDCDALHAVYSDAVVMRHIGGPFETLERTREFVAKHMRHQERHGFSMWALLERASGLVVGDVGFLTDDDRIEIGWRLRRQSWGFGYAMEAAQACLIYGFSELGFSRVSAYVETANVTSVRVIEKLGMRFVRSGATDGPPWAEFALDSTVPTGSHISERRRGREA